MEPTEVISTYYGPDGIQIYTDLSVCNIIIF